MTQSHRKAKYHKITPKRVIPKSKNWSCFESNRLDNYRFKKYLRPSVENTHHRDGSNTVQLISSFTRMDSTASLHTSINVFSFLVKLSHVKLETSRTVSFICVVRSVRIKAANFFYKSGSKVDVSSHVLLESDVFQCRPKSCQIFGPFW